MTYTPPCTPSFIVVRLAICSLARSTVLVPFSPFLPRCPSSLVRPQAGSAQWLWETEHRPLCRRRHASYKRVNSKPSFSSCTPKNNLYLRRSTNKCIFNLLIYLFMGQVLCIDNADGREEERQKKTPEEITPFKYVFSERSRQNRGIKPVNSFNCNSRRGK